MTDHKGLPVHGYAPQSDENIELVNQHKALEELVLRRIDSLTESDIGDGRWRHIARTHIEQGFMALNRSIFQPQRFKLPEED